MRSIVDRPAHFTDLAAIEAEKARLDAVRRHHGAHIERHLELKDREVRGLLLRNAASDLLLSWRPAHALAGMLGGGTLASALGSAIFRRGGLSKRMFSFAARLILPYLLERAGHLSVDMIIREVKKTMARLREQVGATPPTRE